MTFSGAKPRFLTLFFFSCRSSTNNTCMSTSILSFLLRTKRQDTRHKGKCWLSTGLRDLTCLVVVWVLRDIVITWPRLTLNSPLTLLLPPQHPQWRLRWQMCTCLLYLVFLMGLPGKHCHLFYKRGVWGPTTVKATNCQYWDLRIDQ